MQKYILFILAILTSMLSYARRPYFASDDGHYFGIYAQGAYSNIHLLGQNLHNHNGYGAGGGISYEYQWDNYIFNVGCGFLWQEGGYELNDPITFEDRSAYDTQGIQYTLHTYMTRYDLIKRGCIDIPVMFGGNMGMAYMLGGVKVGINVLDKSQLCADITTYGVYDRYISPISQTSNHGFRTNVPIKQPHQLATSMDVRLSLECGINLGELETNGITTVKARVGLFADYGLFTTQFNLNGSFIENRQGNFDFDTYRLQPILLQKSEYFLGNLLAGVRLTVLIGGNRDGQYHCKNCNVLNSQWRGIKYKKKCITCKN